MGQTHHWDYPKNNSFDLKKWNDCVAKISTMIDLCNQGLVRDEKGMPVFIRDENGSEKHPTLTSNLIGFNGEWKEGNDLSHEGFFMARDNQSEEWTTFCKTNGKPYTIMVLAALITFTVYFPKDFKFRTEADEEVLDCALFLYLYSKNPSKPITKQLFIDAKNKLIDLAKLKYAKLE